MRGRKPQGRKQQQAPLKIPYRERQKARNGVQEKEGFGAYVPTQTDVKFVPRNDRQKRAYNLVKTKYCTYLLGPTGTGKTHSAIAAGVELYRTGQIKRFILTSPALEIGEKLGFLPGDVQEKTAMWVRAMKAILVKLLGAGQVDGMIAAGTIAFEPLGSILGATYDDAFIMFDEAQNSTCMQMKILITRFGDRSRMAICGDYREQKFVKGMSGLQDSYLRLRNEPDVGSVVFTEEDIVRHGFVKTAILSYRRNLDQADLVNDSEGLKDEEVAPVLV